MSDPVREAGLEIRQQMFGDMTRQHIEGADAFNRPLQDEVTRMFGEIWTREGLDRKTRSMITLALLASQNRAEEMGFHVRGALANGVTKEEIREVFIHASAYAGIPSAVTGFRVATEIFAQLDKG
jgi:4-carboxymuconolactone decarboxylase